MVGVLEGLGAKAAAAGAATVAAAAAAAMSVALNHDFLPAVTAATSAAGEDITAGEILSRLAEGGKEDIVGDFLDANPSAGITRQQFHEMVEQLKTMDPNKVVVDVTQTNSGSESIVVQKDGTIKFTEVKGKDTDPIAFLQAAKKAATILSPQPK